MRVTVSLSVSQAGILQLLSLQRRSQQTSVFGLQIPSLPNALNLHREVGKAQERISETRFQFNSKTFRLVLCKQEQLHAPGNFSGPATWFSLRCLSWGMHAKSEVGIQAIVPLLIGPFNLLGLMLFCQGFDHICSQLLTYIFPAAQRLL